MPNWCSNSVGITGTAKKIKELDDKFQAPSKRFGGGCTHVRKKDLASQNKSKWLYYRISESKHNKESVDINYIDDITEDPGYSFHNFVPQTKDDYLNGWYDWNNNNWGTKWDVDGSNMNVSGIDDAYDAIAKGNPDERIQVWYHFETAWGPCIPVISAMAAQFPELDIIHEYEEPGVEFAGHIEYEQGVEILNEEAGDNYREFLQKYDMAEFYNCEKCGALLYEYEEESECECQQGSEAGND